MAEPLVAYLDDPGASCIDSLVAGQASPIVVLTRKKTRIVVLNRREARNALTRDMRRALTTVLADADSDADVRALIITGAAGVFCAGVDIKESRSQPAAMVRPHPGEALRALGKPIIAAVDGACVTGGLELALSCSFIVATKRSTFADTHAKVGFFPAWGMTALLPRAIGVRRARQMMLTGSTIDADTALQWGLVNEVVDPAALLARCLALTDAMSELKGRLINSEMALLDQGEAIESALAAEDAAAARWRSETT